MSLRFAVAIVLAASGCRVYAPAPYRAPIAASAASASDVAPGWVAVRPQQSGFDCQMPAVPTVEVRTGHAEDGAAYSTVRAVTTVPYGTFGVIATMWEGGVVGDPLTIADDLADHILAIAELTQHRVVRVTMPGFYAREDTGRAPDGSFVALRQFFGRERIYVALANVPADPTGLRAAEHFMGTIALDRSDALLPTGDSTIPQPIHLPDVDFAAYMPPLASRTSSTLEIGDQRSDAWTFESRHTGGLFRVTVITFDEHLPDGALEAVSRALSLGEPTSYVHASGFPGRAYEPGSDREARAFVTARRVYVVEVTGASALGDEHVRRFFDSFRIL